MTGGPGRGARGPRDRAGALRAFGAICLAAALLLAAVWERVEVARLLSQIDAVKTAKAKLASEVDYLEMQRGRKLSLREVEPLATERLGLGTATVDQVVHLTWDELSHPAVDLRAVDGAPAVALMPGPFPEGTAGGSR